jgi:hypothetical protein
VNLQSDEPSGVGLVHVLVHEIFDRVAIHPGLNPRASRDNTQRVPALVDEVMMARVDLCCDDNQFVPSASP